MPRSPNVSVTSKGTARLLAPGVPGSRLPPACQERPGLLHSGTLFPPQTTPSLFTVRHLTFKLFPVDYVSIKHWNVEG